MAPRIPKAELSTGLREGMINQFGLVPEPVAVVWHHPEVAPASLEFGARAGEWDLADESLKTFAHMAVAAQVGCSWCLFLVLARRRPQEEARDPHTLTSCGGRR